MNASIAIQVTPKTDGGLRESLRIIDEVIAYLKSSGLHTEVGPFETTVEGDYDTLMELVKNAQIIACKAGAHSCAAHVKIAYHPEGDALTIDEKTTKHRN